MTYDPKKAALYNQLIKKGLSEDAAATQAGIGTNDFGSYAIGDNGELGALIVGTGVRPGVEVVTERNTPAQVNYPQTASGLPAQQPAPKTVFYTTTSTETVSGGGSTTITAGQPQSTPQSRAVQPAIDAKQAEIDQFIKDNPSDFARKRQGLPPLTPQQAVERQARLSTLEDQRSQLTNQQLGLTTPGTPTITTIPNTTTTTTTTTFGSSTSNQPVDFLDDPELSRQSEIQIDRVLPPPVTATTPRPSGTTVARDDPNAGEAEARAFLQQQQTPQNIQPDTGFTYYGAPAVAPTGPPQSTATVNPNPWAGSDAEKAAAWARLSPADQRWLGNGDPTDPFILRRAPNGGQPDSSLSAVRETAPAPLPDDNLAFEPPPDDNLAFTQGTDPGAGYGVTFDEFGNEIPRQPPVLPDDNLAYTEGVSNTAGYSFEDTGGVPTQTLSDFPVSDTAGYSFEDTGGVPTQTLSDFPVSDTAGYNTFEDTGGVPTQRLSDFTDPGPGYGASDDNLGFEPPPDDDLAFTQGADPGPGYGFAYDDNGELIPADSIQAQSLATDDTNPGPGYGVSDDNLGFEAVPDDNLAFQDTEVDDTDGYIVPDGSINVPDSQVEFAPTALGGNFSAQYDVESGTYGVFDNDTGQFVQTGLTEQEATLLAEDASVGDPNFAGNADAFGGDTGVPDVPESEVAFAPTALGGDFVAAFDPETGTWGVFDNESGVFVQTGLTEQEAILLAQEASVGDPNFAGNPDAATDPGLTPEQAEAQAQEQAEADAARAAIEQAARERARIAQAIEAQRRQANEGDWRVKLRLAAGADYLYRDPNINKDGVLWPLSVTDGVIFPYTPVITTNYVANYNPYDLTHSNFRGYFYQNSTVDEVTIQAVFTAQDTTEANYMLAVIHFFRSVTKMFYGQDPNRGLPPPLVFLQGLGEFQFNLHPCVVRSFTYSMPNDIDYIRARSPNFDGTSLLKRRDRQTQSLAPYNASASNLQNSGLPAGAEPGNASVPTLGTKTPTYVPTRLETTITLLPMQTRQQVSQEFSLRDYANGELVRRGFW